MAKTMKIVIRSRIVGCKLQRGFGLEEELHIPDFVTESVERERERSICIEESRFRLNLQFPIDI
jgi:hypothetical protein